jgi:hypothetical protein
VVRRWAPALVLLGLLAGCESTPADDGTPEAAPVPAGSGLPPPDEPTGPATTSAAPPPTTTAPTRTPPVATPTRTAPASRRCPADVAATLPGSRPATPTLIAGFRTSRYQVYYCRTAAGQLYYRGINRADAAKATTLPARRIAGGFEARGVEAGSVYVFRVAQGRLSVIQDGKQIFVDPIIATL